MKEFSCSMTIGDITPQTFKDFQLVFEEKTDEFKVKSFDDGFEWGIGKTPKGAVISALRQGIRMKNIDLNDIYVPIHECIRCVKE